ncbi:MAG: hypothetical protein WD751_02680 [Anaerolineales bacterium]
MNKNRSKQLAALAFLLIFASACTATDGGLGAAPSATPQPELPTATTTETATASPTPFETPDPNPVDSLSLLRGIVVPEKDEIELANRFLNIEDVPESLPAPEEYYRVGDRRMFWVIDIDSETDEPKQIEAVLRYVGDEIYFWVERGVNYAHEDLVRLATTFEDSILPTDREFFGREWNPGVDNDPHIYILVARVGGWIAGYFSPWDEINPAAQEHSNGAEMFVIAADMSFRDEFTYAVLAHELQHMIHWYLDKNEALWINEGLSELAIIVNGYHAQTRTEAYTIQPDHQLNDWPSKGNPLSNYASSLTFFAYFLQRFGEEATQAVVVNPANGLESIDVVFSELALDDPLNGEQITTDSVILDWAVANYLNDPALADGRYGYPAYPNLITFPVPDTELVEDCDAGSNARQVHQYGIDYICIACRGQATLRFEGATDGALLPASAFSGDYAFWSNQGDDSDMTLTRAFDLRNVEAPIQMSFRTWYDLEEDFDYVYLLASTNGGEDWEFITTASGTDTDPNDSNYGFGYTGTSSEYGDWTLEAIDLSEYAGQEVVLRFEYITDSGVNKSGFLLDDVAIPAVGYFADFETGDGGWQTAGFARISNPLPQTFRLALVSFGDETTVQILEVPDTNVVEIPLDFTGEVDSVTLVVMGTSRFTRLRADYSFTFIE